MFTFGRRASWGLLSRRFRPAEKALALGIAKRLTPRGSKLPSPAAISRFVYENSWHYHWEQNAKATPQRHALALALWVAGGDYLRLLDRDGEQRPSADAQENLRRLVHAAAGGALQFLECGHRALAAAAIAESIGMPVRYVTLYSGGPVTSVWTHHLLELKGEHGWEMHDPDYGFCFRTEAGHIASAEEVMTTTVSVEEYRPTTSDGMPDHVQAIITGGYFAAISTRYYEDDETLFVSNGYLASATFKHNEEDLPFPDYWRRVLSGSKKQSVVFTDLPVLIKGGSVP
jgi:hypothetical protein